MPRKPDLADLIRNRIASNRRAAAFIREDFIDFGDYDQIGRALRELVSSGDLLRIGYGIYAKTRRSIVTGKPVPTKPLISIAAEGLRKLGYKVAPSKAAQAYREGRSTQFPVRQALNLGEQRVSRAIQLGRDKIVYETAKPRRRNQA